MRTILLGNGGHAKVLLDIIGPVSETLDASSEDRVFDYAPESVVLINAVGSVRSCKVRHAIFSKFSRYRFMRVIHPSAIISRSAQIGEGVQIMAGAVVQPGAVIGDNTIINTRASVDHDCRIGVSCHIAPGAVLSGGVVVGDRCHVGTAASVIQGINIGADSFIAAGRCVYRDVPDGAQIIKVAA